MKGIVGAETLDEFVSELLIRYKHLTPNKNEHNSLGFNSDPLRTNCDVCYYGCSWTHGVGVNCSNRWTDLIDVEKVYLSNNFGIPGACIEDILSVFVTSTKFVKMEKAFFLLPDYARQTLKIDTEKFINIFPEEANRYKESKIWFSLPTDYYADKAQTAINLITFIAKLKNIEVYFSSWSPEVFKLLPNDRRTKHCYQNDYQGNDNVHPGPLVHDNIASDFIELL